MQKKALITIDLDARRVVLYLDVVSCVRMYSNMHGCVYTYQTFYLCNVHISISQTF